MQPSSKMGTRQQQYNMDYDNELEPVQESGKQVLDVVDGSSLDNVSHGFDSMDELVLDEEITLISGQGDRFTVTRREISLSHLVVNVLDSDSEAEEINLPNIKSSVFPLVLEYLRHCQGVAPPEITKPIRSSKMEELASEWEASFINRLPVKELYQVILAAHYLDIRPLMGLGCAKVATMIKGKSPAEIKGVLQGSDSENVDPAAVVGQNN